MKEKITAIINTPKKKIAAVIVSGMLVLALGTGAILAANAISEKGLVRSEDGVITHSSDDGATWSKGYPEGAIVNDDGNGNISVTNDITTGDFQSSMDIKIENGVNYYSTDGGKTWSAEAPSGVTVNEDSSVSNSYANPNGNSGSSEKGLVKSENGVVTHSSDDGATWNEGYPEGAIVDDDGRGNISVTNDIITGDVPNSMDVKVENGVNYYSTDGGKTWNIEVPNGVTTNEDGSISGTF